MVEYKYVVIDDGQALKQESFDKIEDAIAYAKQGKVPFIFEYQVVEGELNPDSEELVWTWDDIWDADEDVIARIKNGHFDAFDVDESFNIEVNKTPEGVNIRTSGDEASELMDFARAILGDNFDVFDQDFADVDVDVSEEESDVPAADFDYAVEEPSSEDNVSEVDPFKGTFDKFEDKEFSETTAEEPTEELDDESEPVDEVPEEEKELVAEIEKTPADESPKDMINGKLVDAKDPTTSEVEIDEDDEDVEESLTEAEEKLEEDPETINEEISIDQFSNIEAKLKDTKNYSIDLEWEDDRDHFNVVIDFNKISDSFEAATSIYHASEDNNAEHEDWYTDEGSDSAKSLKELYDQLAGEFGGAFEDEFFKVVSSDKLLECTTAEFVNEDAPTGDPRLAAQAENDYPSDKLDAQANAYEEEQAAWEEEQATEADLESRIPPEVVDDYFDADDLDWPEPDNIDELPIEGEEIPFPGEDDIPPESAADYYDDMSDEEFALAFGEALVNKKRQPKEADEEK